MTVGTDEVQCWPAGHACLNIYVHTVRRAILVISLLVAPLLVLVSAAEGAKKHSHQPPCAFKVVKTYCVGPGQDLRRDDFSGANLSGMNLTKVNFGGANLTGANPVSYTHLTLPTNREV